VWPINPRRSSTQTQPRFARRYGQLPDSQITLHHVSNPLYIIGYSLPIFMRALLMFRCNPRGGLVALSVYLLFAGFLAYIYTDMTTIYYSAGKKTASEWGSASERVTHVLGHAAQRASEQSVLGPVAQRASGMSVPSPPQREGGSALHSTLRSLLCSHVCTGPQAPRLSTS